jgi:asparagine synthase (glutamine-hydrolysing)
MPGLSAVALASEPAVDRIVPDMLERMLHYPWLRAVRCRSGTPAVGLGVVAHATRAAGSSATADDGLTTVAVDGEIFDTDGESPAAFLLKGWQQEGLRALGGLNGEFAALVWDAARRQLHVVTDRFGLRCLYVAQPPGAFVAASEIKALLAVPGIDTRWSEAGVAEFFSFGHFYNDDTLLAGIRAVPPATCGTYRLSEDSYSETRYWQRRSGSLAGGSTAEKVAALEERFVMAVRRRAQPGERLGLSLSGGLDARTILGVAPPDLDLQAVSLGIDGSLDHRSAAELAAIAGVPHHPYVLDAGFLDSFETHLRQMVHLTDGHYLDQGIVMPTMPFYRDLGIEYLLRGHGGELLHMTKAYAFSLDAAALRASDAQLDAWLLSHLTGYMLEGVPADLFTIDLRGGAEAALGRALAQCVAKDRPADRVWQLFLDQRIHRETALSMHTFGCFVTVRQPYLDADVVDSVLSLPADIKLRDELQAGILAHRRPAFLKVTNSNTGTRVGAGRLATEMARFRLRIGAKLGWKGYQPYERLGLWLRRELRAFVQSTLAGERFLQSGLVRPDAVKRVVSRHMAGEANHTFLLMALLVFALGQETLGRD